VEEFNPVQRLLISRSKGGKRNERNVKRKRKEKKLFVVNQFLRRAMKIFSNDSACYRDLAESLFMISDRLVALEEIPARQGC
jgi:hypothetical protein